MKPIFLLFTIAILYLLTSCGKNPYPEAGITVSYPELTNSETLKAKRTDRNNLSVIIDTLVFGQLNPFNSYSAIIIFENDSPNYILYVENTSYIDTISEIVFERKGRNEEIKNFRYKFNGQTRTSTKLTIK